MDKFEIVRKEEGCIVFATSADLESAYELLKNGSEIMISYYDGTDKVSEILQSGIISDIIDSKFEFKSEEVKNG